MKIHFLLLVILTAAILLLPSCSVLEKASVHGLKSDYYKLKSANNKPQNVYIDLSEEKIDVYQHTKKIPDKNPMMSIPLKDIEDTLFKPLLFKKQSLDIDITSTL